MRIIGDNSSGFQNEIDFEKSLNLKTIEELNPNLQNFLRDVYRNYSLCGKTIHAKRITTNVKPDFLIQIDGIPGTKYISVKKGSGNSVHQEKISNFVNFLKENNANNEIINDLLQYHYSDGTTNNTGTTRKSAKAFSQEHPQTIKSINKFFNSVDLLTKSIDRFLFVGNLQNAPTVDYLYHGDINNGVWASRKEIFDFIKLSHTKDNTVCFGPLTYQCWNKNLNFSNKLEPRRYIMQIKWGSLEDCLTEITSRREDYLANGTFKGELSEKACVISFNKNPASQIFKSYLNHLNISAQKTLMVRVTTKQLSKLSNRVVNTRADAYAIEILDQRILKVLEMNDYYLDESILKNFKQYYRCITNSGISIKKDYSEHYSIIKFTPDSFYKVFGSYELGYGASIFSKNLIDLHLNIPLLNGWHTNVENVGNYFPCWNITEKLLTSSCELCGKIKNHSCSVIRHKIDNEEKIKKLIFNGIGVYDEPYTAHFLAKNQEIKQFNYIPFYITTGSGRSHGNYTLVLKPKQGL